ncbi:hypothetical protein [Bradyrhizobium genosp. A]|uniref:hypothetical protein n=1 Tax=Bradyrhizobium genosp. A TaxID=83626 RepID=UPI003CEA10FD
MPVLTIGDKSVTVGDEFLKLSPDQQNATVQEIAGSIGVTGNAAAPPEAAPVTANSVVRSAATGVPIVGGLMNKLNAASNAALAPMLNRFFAPEDQLAEPAFSERYAHSLRDQEGADKKFAAEHPVIDTAAQLAGGIASTVVPMSAAPKAFGLTGSMFNMARNGALSGAAVSGADAAVRGEDPAAAAGLGGIIGGAAGPVGKGVGKVVAAVADRIKPPATVARNVESVAGVDVPLSQSQITQNPALSAEEQIMLRGGRGDAAQGQAQGFKDLQDERVSQARDTIAAGLDPTGQSARTAPQDAAERIASELLAQEQQRQAAAAGVHAGPMSPAQQAQDMARALAPDGQLRAASPIDAGEVISDRLAAARDAAKTDYRGKYAAVDAAPGEFAPGSAGGFGNDVEQGLRSAAVSLDKTNTPKALNALRVIDEHLNAVAPGEPGAAAAVAPDHARNVADIRAKFGDAVASAYDRQAQAAAAEGRVPTAAPTQAAAENSLRPLSMDERSFLKRRGWSDADIAEHGDAPELRAELARDVPMHTSQAPAPKTQSLLEFIASKGGLGPDAELAAIGGEGHTVNVEGVGRRKLVRQGGLPLDYAREAAQEAGYLRGDHNGTSTVNDLLDAINAEMRGQKRYPEGFEGHVGKREAAAMSERQQAEFDRHMQGFEEDLHAAGHGELGPEVKDRAIKLMANDGMPADTAVEHALRQLEQEDATGALHGAIFPGDRPAAAAPQAAAPASGSGFTMRDVEQVRKQISTLYGDARRAMLGGGSGSDLHALEHIRDQFDARVEKMLADGKFSGDGPAVLKMQQEARAAFADYKAKFAKRGPGDTIGAAVEKILGRFSDTRATPDEVVKLAYGSATSPGGQMPVQIAQRIKTIFGEKSAEFGAYKQGLFAHLTAGEPEAAAERVRAFLDGKGRLLAQTVFSPGERKSLAQYADRLLSSIPAEQEKGAVASLIRKVANGEASPNELVNALFGASGKGAGSMSVPLAQKLKASLPPEAWTSIRQGMFEKLTRAGEGKIEFEAQALSQRLHEFLNESGSQLAKTLYSPREIDLMRKLANVYKQMIPVKGTTNPSGTAPMLARMAGGLRSTLLPLLGLTHGGLPGAAMGAVLDKGVTAARNANDARKATELFYGPQAKRVVDPRFAQGVGLLGFGSLPTITGGGRR